MAKNDQMGAMDGGGAMDDPATETTAQAKKSAKPGKMNTLCVPLDALNLDSEDGSGGTAPEVGDEVEITVKGTVSQLEGGEAYIKVETANDAPVVNESDETTNEGDESSEPDLAEMARQADEQGGLL